MNRILKRPMFRMGGGVETQGIMTGVRGSYQNGDVVKKVQDRLKLLDQIAPQPGRGFGSQPLNDFLINFGLNLASTPPTGNILQTAAGAAKEPFSILQAQTAQSRLSRQGLAQDILKDLTDEDVGAIEQEIQLRMDELGEDRATASKTVLDRRAFGVLNEPGELRRKEIDSRSLVIQDQQRVSKPVADNQAEFEVDYRKFEKSNPDTSFDISNPFWGPKRKKYIEGYTYLDPSSGKFLRRSSGAAGDPNNQIPAGFEDVSADIKRP